MRTAGVHALSVVADGSWPGCGSGVIVGCDEDTLSAAIDRPPDKRGSKRKVAIQGSSRTRRTLVV